MDAGEEEIRDADERSLVRRQAARVHAKSIAFGVALTLAALLLPRVEGEEGLTDQEILLRLRSLQTNYEA